MTTSFEELPIGERFERFSDRNKETEETGLIYEKISPVEACAWGVPQHTERFDSSEEVCILPALF